jgi:hypothetical protein
MQFRGLKTEAAETSLQGLCFQIYLFHTTGGSTHTNESDELLNYLIGND